MDRFLEILRGEATKIHLEFGLASKQGSGTPQEIAKFRENAVQDFLKRFYPQNYVISQGKITGLDGSQSNSIDCLLVNPSHPYLTDASGSFRLIIADGCDAAIEVKPDLGRTDELLRVLGQGISVKEVKRSKTPILSVRKLPEIVEHSLYIPFFVFALNAFEPEKMYFLISEYYRNNKIPLENQIDGICISGKGLIRNIKHKELNSYGAPQPIGDNTGWYFEEWADATLAGFLLSIQSTFPAVPTVTTSIVLRILKQIGYRYVNRLGDAIY